MNLSKNRIVMISVGGVAVLSLATLLLLSFFTLSEKSETDDDLETAESQFKRLAKGKVAPTKAAHQALVDNERALIEWRSNALEQVSKADVVIDRLANGAAFKQKMNDDARQLAKLPGGVEGAIVKSDFAFGFDRFIGGGELPAPETLVALQREWSDIAEFTRILSQCGATELVKVEVKTPAVQPPAEGRRGKGKEAEAEAPSYVCEKYAFEVLARPAAMIKVLNALTGAQRFVIVESLSFARAGDMIGDALSDKKAEPTGGRKRGRGRRVQEENAEQEAENAKKSGILTDPEEEQPFLVKLSLSTYDFGVSKEVKE